MNTLERLKQLEAEAAPGPWEHRFRGTIGMGSLYSGSSQQLISHQLIGEMRLENSQFIAELRNAFLALLAVAEAAEDLRTSLNPRGPVLTDNNPRPLSIKESLALLTAALAVLKKEDL